MAPFLFWQIVLILTFWLFQDAPLAILLWLTTVGSYLQWKIFTFWDEWLEGEEVPAPVPRKPITRFQGRFVNGLEEGPDKI